MLAIATSRADLLLEGLGDAEVGDVGFCVVNHLARVETTRHAAPPHQRSRSVMSLNRCTDFMSQSSFQGHTAPHGLLSPPVPLLACAAL